RPISSAILVGALPRVRRRDGQPAPRPGRTHRSPPGAACPAPSCPAEPRRTSAVRDPPVGPLDWDAVLSRRGGRPPGRDGAPARRRGPRGGPGHHVGAGGRFRRGPAHAFGGSWGGAAPRIA